MSYIEHNKLIEMHYDVISKRFDASRVRIWERVKHFLGSKQDCKRLLDVGCGNSKNIIYARSLGYSCVGIDISQKLVDISESKGVETYKCDVMDLNHKSFGLFDTILCIAVLHHLQDISTQKAAITNMIDCLSTRGKLLVSFWSFEKDDSDNRDFMKGVNYVNWNNEIQRFYYIHDFTSLKNMLDSIDGITYKLFWEKQNWYSIIEKMMNDL